MPGCLSIARSVESTSFSFDSVCSQDLLEARRNFVSSSFVLVFSVIGFKMSSLDTEETAKQVRLVIDTANRYV